MSKLWLPPRHAAEKLGIDRRTFLGASLVTGAGALTALALAGCDSKGPKSAAGLLAASERFNEKLERALFRHTAMNVAPPGRPARRRGFPSYFIAASVPVWDETRARRLAAGDRRRRGAPAAAHARRPHGACRARSCASSTSASRAGRRSRSARACASASWRAAVGLSPDARYVDFQSFDDDYHESWDLDERAAPADADRLRPGRRAARPGLRRAGPRLLAGQARLQEHQVPDAHPLPAREERRLLERPGLRVVRRRRELRRRRNRSGGRVVCFPEASDDDATEQADAVRWGRWRRPPRC